MKILFFKKLLLFIAIYFLLDYTLGSAVNALNNKSPTPFNMPLLLKADIYILGNSVGRNHYNPIITANALTSTVYNAALGGKYYDYNYGLMRLIAKRHRPKLWVIIVNSNSLLTHKRTALSLAPRLSEDAVVRELVFKNLDTPFEKYRYVSRLIRFNQIAPTALWGLVNPSTNRTGFVPLDGHLPELQSQQTLEELDIDHFQLDKLRDMVHFAKELGSEIIFAMAPKYYYNFSPYQKKPYLEIKTMDIYQNLADELDVVLLDHTPSGIPEFYEARFFKDPGHLNRAGSKIISARLADDIISLIESKKLMYDFPTTPKDALQKEHSDSSGF